MQLRKLNKIRKTNYKIVKITLQFLINYQMIEFT